MTITITKTHVLVFLGMLAIIAIMRIVWICGYDSGAGETRVEYCKKINELKEQYENARDELQYHTLDTMYNCE